ncbi:MAG: prolyl oligopeptidase family serine peptidase [Acidobacteriota bacterium]
MFLTANRKWEQAWLPRAAMVICFLLVSGHFSLAQDYSRLVRELRPSDVGSQEQALLDTVEREAKAALEAIQHAQNAKEADQRRPILRRLLEEALGTARLGGRPDVQARSVGVLVRPGYRLEKMVWQSLPGVSVAAHLYLPERAQAPLPAILFYVGHWWADSKTRPDFQAFCINMARLGFAVLTWDPFGQGERGVSSRDHRRVESLLVGVAQQGIAEYETQCALSYLLSRPDIDPARLGMTGASGGGYNTWITAALDDRISVAVPVVGTSEFYEQIHVTRPLDWYRASEHCHFVPGLIRFANNHELLAMVSPRPLLIIAAAEDQSFPVSGVRQVVEYGRRLYQTSHNADRIGFFVDRSSGHGYQQKKREAAYGWFLKWLAGRGSGEPYPEPPTETTAFDAEELRCFPPGQNQAAGPGIVAAVRRIAEHIKPKRSIPSMEVFRPDVPMDPAASVQRLMIPVEDGLRLPAFWIRGRSREVLLALDDRGKEFLLEETRVTSALQDGASLCGVDVRGIGELATSKVGWLSAVSLLLGDSFPVLQSRDLMTAASLFEGQPLTLFARGPNAVLAATAALPNLHGLRHYTLKNGFRSVRDFLERPQSLEASYVLRQNNDERFAYDREIPFFWVPWGGLVGPDLNDFLKATKAQGTLEAMMNGDWEVLP